MSGPLDGLSPEARERLRPRKQPSWTAPMLATLTDEPFSDEKWIFERKLDGERCLAFRKGKTVRLMSRNRKRLNDTYPELVDALGHTRSRDFVVDGEIVAFEGGVTSFSRLQNRMKIKDPEEARRSRVAVYYYLFDILHLDGHDTTGLPLRERKRLLKRAISFRNPLRYTAHRNAEGEAYHRRACRKGWEGVIAKRADGRYVHGRSRGWLKFKCVHEQELVVGGYTDPQGSRIGFGALLVGYYSRGRLVYAGMVGTGYDTDTLERLGRRLRDLETGEPPFSPRRSLGRRDGLPRKGVHWVKPRLVAQVGFTEWTEDDKLRHPRFLGLRRDKNPKDVVRERAAG